MPAVARKFIQGRHPGRYFRSKQLPILASAKRPCIALVTITVYLTLVVSKLSMADRRMAVRILGTGRSDSGALS